MIMKILLPKVVANISLTGGSAEIEGYQWEWILCGIMPRQ